MHIPLRFTLILFLGLGQIVKRLVAKVHDEWLDRCSVAD
jgi:hypothetical protein